MRSRNRKGKRQRRKWLVIEIACAAAFLVLAGTLIMRLTRQSHRAAEERAAQEALTRIQTEQTIAPTTAPTSAPAPSEAPPQQMFAYAQELLKTNGDLVGMVGFDDMTLYVCQGEDNTFYASRRCGGSEVPAGMFYRVCRCSAWPLGA